jgi:hypothetical protein
MLLDHAQEAFLKHALHNVGEAAATSEPVSFRTPGFRDIGISNITIRGAK